MFVGVGFLFFLGFHRAIQWPAPPSEVTAGIPGRLAGVMGGVLGNSSGQLAPPEVTTAIPAVSPRGS